MLNTLPLPLRTFSRSRKHTVATVAPKAGFWG